jgi:hypothetical protein|tara:strand:- start:126 stop:347 length:222 start_codon:yes stop_codon:yes gene_type:complete
MKVKIRNVKYADLNEKEKQIVNEFYKERVCDDESSCIELVPNCNNSIEEFWENHREMDTDNGNYDGWTEPEKL